MIGLALMGFDCPAKSQFAYPPIVVVPPPPTPGPKSEAKTPSANRPKSSADTPQAPPAQSYHGQTRALDRF
jgi:hypothetical protein